MEVTVRSWDSEGKKKPLEASPSNTPDDFIYITKGYSDCSVENKLWGLEVGKIRNKVAGEKEWLNPFICFPSSPVAFSVLL